MPCENKSSSNQNSKAWGCTTSVFHAPMDPAGGPDVPWSTTRWNNNNEEKKECGVEVTCVHRWGNMPWFVGNESACVGWVRTHVRLWETSGMDPCGHTAHKQQQRKKKCIRGSIWDICIHGIRRMRVQGHVRLGPPY
jgi:hypothetical protein